MNMYLGAILLYILLNTVHSHKSTKDKCCKSDEYLQNNGTYQCVKDESKRLEAVYEKTNLLEAVLEGECIDIINNNFSVFQINNGNITSEETLKAKYYPKCCPLNYYYNTVLHSCVETYNLTYDYITETFIKVGLPICKLIVDYECINESDLNDNVKRAMRRNGDYCTDKNEKGYFTLRQCKDDMEDCSSTRCIKKCCPDGQSFVNRYCVDTYTNGINLSFTSRIEQAAAPFYIISNYTCDNTFYKMDEGRFIFDLNEKGEFKYWHNFANSFIRQDIDSKYSYCIEHSQSENEQDFFFFNCLEKVDQKKFEYTLVLKVLSCIFLSLTITIYIILGETKNLFGKILMNYCAATLIMFALLVYANMDLSPLPINCKLRAYSLIFLSTASFAWLNVMCWDIWGTFGSTRSACRHQSKENLRKLLLYLLYGWGLPMCLSLVILFLSETAFLPYYLHPFVGEFKCLIENRGGNYAEILFFRLPHLIIQLVNTALFFKTIINCLRIKSEINKFNDTYKYENTDNYKKNKDRLLLIVKLSVVMGITFTFDVIFSCFNMSEIGTFSENIEIASNCINCLQGVFIFIIFICKKKVVYDILGKMKLPRRKSTSNNRQLVPMRTTMSIINSIQSESS